MQFWSMNEDFRQSLISYTKIPQFKDNDRSPKHVFVYEEFLCTTHKSQELTEMLLLIGNILSVCFRLSVAADVRK